MDYLKYTVWPYIKVKGMHLWWTVRYGGKKNIPPEVIFDQLGKSMKRFTENMEQAFRHMPEDLSDSEKGEVVRLMGLAKKFEAGVKDLDPQKRE